MSHWTDRHPASNQSRTVTDWEFCSLKACWKYSDSLFSDSSSWGLAQWSILVYWQKTGSSEHQLLIAKLCAFSFAVANSDTLKIGPPTRSRAACSSLSCRSRGCQSRSDLEIDAAWLWLAPIVALLRTFWRTLSHYSHLKEFSFHPWLSASFAMIPQTHSELPRKWKCENRRSCCGIKGLYLILTPEKALNSFIEMSLLTF